MSTRDRDPLVLNAYPNPPSAGRRLLERERSRPLQPQAPTRDDSQLLKAIRAAFQGSGKKPEPPIRSVVSASVDGPYGEEELAWDETTVAWSIGGVLRNTWSFEEEEQRVQYACFGWLHSDGTIHTASNNARHTTNDPDSDEEERFSYASHSSRGDDKDVFGLFFRAKKAQMRTIEPSTIARAVFIFLRNFGRIYLMNGNEFSFSLPFIVQKAWALSPHGILLQRVVDPAELDEPDPPLPTLYTLTNPFQEPRPVGLAGLIKGGHGLSENKAELVRQDVHDGLGSDVLAEEQVVWTAPKLVGDVGANSVLVTLNHEKCRLTFWRYALISHNESEKYVKDSTFPHHPKAGDKQQSQARQAGNDLVSRGDRIRAPSPEFEPLHPGEMGEMALPPFQSMPPPLTSTSTLASLGSGGSSGYWPQVLENKGRKSSLSRNDLSLTMDRLVLDRKSDASAQLVNPALRESVIPAYWVQHLYELELSDEE